MGHDEYIIHPLACLSMPPSLTHSLSCALAHKATKKKYDDVKRRGDQAAEQVERQKQRVALLESKLEEYRKVCNKTKLSFTFTH